MTFYDPERTLIADWEVYPNLTCFGLRRVSDGKELVLEWSRRKQSDRDRLAALLRNNLIIGYNWTGYDQIISAAMVNGYTNDQMKRLNDQIILGGLKYWQTEENLGFRIPRNWKFIDLMEPQPNAFASLKTLAGRMHAPKMQDLPYEPDQVLTESQMDDVISYMGNDLHVTHMLFDWLREPLELRAFLSKQYDMDLMSKSDAQVAEAVIKRVAEQKTGERINKPVVKAGSSFRYNPPDFLEYTNPQLRQIFERVKTTDFYIQNNGKVELPKWISDAQISIGSSTFAMGIGGLHSTEKNRAVHSDEDHKMADADVTGFYPQIIINSGLYPVAIGPVFCEVFATFKRERDQMKPMLKDKSIPPEEMETLKSGVEARKLYGNGSFGKTSSPYSCLYSPHLTIYTTLTGQLSILMLIDMVHQAGAEVVSANTDGIVIRARREDMGSIVKDRVTDGLIKEVIEDWEQRTGFNLEAVEYQSIYNASVNTYIAVKPDGSAKLKGAIANPWRTGDKRGSLMKNPSATIVSNAVVDFITKGTPIEETILGGTDIRDYVTVVNVKGGGTWRDQYLGKVVRYIYGYDGAEILYKTPDARTGNHRRVPKSDGAIPMMELPAEFPAHLIDYDRYIAEAREMLCDIGFDRRPDPIKPIRLYKWSAPLFWAIAV